jgi:hypothetical protein
LGTKNGLTKTTKAGVDSLRIVPGLRANSISLDHVLGPKAHGPVPLAVPDLTLGRYYDLTITLLCYVLRDNYIGEKTDI